MYAEINGAELYYEVHGEENDQAIIALHGGPGVSNHEKSLRAYKPLTDQYKLVVYDHRGCGKSEEQRPYSNEQFTDDVEGLRQHLDLGDIIVIGGSYGGFIAQEYAIRYSNHLLGVVLRDTAPSGEHDEIARANAKARFPELEESDLDVPEITEEDFDRIMDGNARSDEDIKRVFHGMLPLYVPDADDFDPEAARNQLEERNFTYETHNTMFTEEHPNMDYTGDLPNVEVPVLVTVGRHDFITPPEASEEIHDLLPNSRLVIFEESGHSPNIEQQEEFLATVREFFDEIGVTPRPT